ncbi:hypothetical protein F7725_012487, partial [Dissostichus mawsoni]
MSLLKANCSKLTSNVRRYILHQAAAESIIFAVNTNTFWMSTGMFPQEFIIRFAEPTDISAVTVDSYNVKHLKIEKNTSQNASQFESVTEKGKRNSRRQHLFANLLNGSGATHLRLIITSGYDHFASVHR